MSTTRDRLEAYEACELAILKGGQQVRAPDGRNVSMPDLLEVRAQIDKLRALVSRENRGGVGVALADFTDDRSRCR